MRWNEAICVADLRAQSPSLAITMRALFRTPDDIKATGFSGQTDEPLRSDF